MSHNSQTGKEGEELAVNWLQEQGFTVLSVNWRFSRYEIDVICCRGNILHFIEVKTRNSIMFGHPEESVTGKKLESMMNAGEEYLFRNPKWKQVQYDVLSITRFSQGNIEYYFIEDVYDDSVR